MVTTLRIREIVLDFQQPENLVEEWVQEYVAKFQNGECIEPISVRFDGSKYLLFDGFHRLNAAIRIGLDTIEAEVSLGTLAEMEAEWRCGLETIKRGLREDH